MTAVNHPAKPTTRTTAAPRHAAAPWTRIRAWRPLPHVLLALAFTAVWTFLSVLREQHSGDFTYDNAIFTEAIKGWATHGWPVVPIKGPGFNLLGDHWSPILATLAPFWWLWPSTLMVVTAQACLFGWSVGVVSDTGGRILGRARGMAIAVAYGLSFGLQQGLDTGFHEWAFAVPLLAVVGRQLVLGRPMRAFWWALPLLLVKEDMGPVIAVVGALIAWRYRRAWIAALLVVAGLGGTLLEVLVLIPHFNSHGRYDYFTYSVLPHKEPWWRIMLGAFWPFPKWQMLGWTFGITAFACLRSRILLLAAPILAWRFAASDPGFWNMGWYYSETCMPIVFVAAIDGLDRMSRSRQVWQRWYRRQAIPGMVAAAIALTASIPLGVAFLFEGSTYRQTPLDRDYLAADAVVPPGVIVSADLAQLSMLAGKDDVAWQTFNDTKVQDWAAPEYVCNDNTLWNETDPVAWADSRYHGHYRIVFQQGDVTVLQRTS